MIDVEVRMTEPQTVAYMRMHGPFTQIPEALKSIYAWTGMHLMQPAGMPTAVYHTIPEDGDDSSADWEVYTPVARDPKEREPDKKGRGVRRTGPQLVAVTIHKGSYDKIAGTYEALQAWVDENGYRMAGPPEESYLNDPRKATPEEYLTELRFPVEKVGG